METFYSPYAARFSQTFRVNTARDLLAWTEHNEVVDGAEWPVDAYQNTGDPDEARFILAVPTPAGMVGFFAASAADADRIRSSVF